MQAFEESTEKLAQLMLDRNWRMATVESCTGGWIAQSLTSLSGSSDWFDCGLVTYSNCAKERFAGVSQELIAAHGAVSAEVALAMAAGTRSRIDVEVAVAVTGIAGPSGGSEQKPVGTVYIAWEIAGRDPLVERFHFHGDREAIRRQSVATAIEELINCLQNSD
ncbi:MAG: CinA family protein [Gammaproteobacteria bacterium]|nr:CinA family protein [Gammaproteobacteria bacterium]